jgi:signal peptidase I
LEIIDGFVHTNGKKNLYSSRTKIQFAHTVYAQKGVSSRKLLTKGFESFYRKYKIENITETSYRKILPHILRSSGNSVDDFFVFTDSKGLPPELIRKLGLRVSELLEAKKDMTLTLKEAADLRTLPGIDSVTQRVSKNKVPNESFFPNKLPFNWNEDNFGPLLIPRKGMTVKLDRSNLPLYKKIIIDYELNQLEMTPSEILVNGKPTSSYTFLKDYYWMMGDNRHRSEDSRFWGFVPDDHIVGKPIFIWFSIKGINDGIKNWSIRWNRVFTTVDGPGERFSYFPYFVGIVILWQVIVYILRKKTKKVT